MSNPFEVIDARLSNIESLLRDLALPPNPARPLPNSENEELLTVQETAAFLKLSVPTIYSMIHEKRIPIEKPSKRVYFRKSDLDNYLKQGRKKSSTEISRDADDFIENKKRLPK